LFYINYSYYLRINKNSKEERLVVEKVRISAEKIIKLYKILKIELNKILKRIIKIVNKKRFKELDFKEGEIVYINIKNIKI